MKEIIFDKNQYKTYEEFFVDLFKKLNSDMAVPMKANYNANTTLFLNRLLDSLKNQNINIVFKNFNLLYNKLNRDNFNYDFIGTLDFFEYYASINSKIKIQFIDYKPLPIKMPSINQVIFINRSAYKDYKDFYEDLYKKLDAEKVHDFDFCKNTFGYNADTLYEFLEYCSKDNIKFVFLNFDRDRIKEQKNFNDYKINIMLEVFEDFVKKYPNNQIEFREE